MEILRDLNTNAKLKGIRSFRYGCLEELQSRASTLRYPLVLKPAADMGSSGVTLVRGEQDAIARARVLSRSLWMNDMLKNIIKRVLRRPMVSVHRRKFILQDFVPGLAYDYKVVAFGERYFVLIRRVRKNDFRASGSGLFEFPTKPPAGLLDFAEDATHSFDVPFASYDIGFTGSEFALFEFQFVRFGTFTAEAAPCCFRRVDGQWRPETVKVSLEEALSDAVVNFVSRKRCQP